MLLVQGTHFEKHCSKPSPTVKTGDADQDCSALMSVNQTLLLIFSTSALRSDLISPGGDQT